MERTTLLNYDIALQMAKNKDYGNNFDKTCDKYGLVAAKIRMDDKISRLIMLTNFDANVANESTFDTWLDLFNYACMTTNYILSKSSDACNVTDAMHQHLDFDNIVDIMNQNAVDNYADASYANDINYCQNLVNTIHEYFYVNQSISVLNLDAMKDEVKDRLLAIINACNSIAKTAFSRCLQYDETYLNARYLNI